MVSEKYENPAEDPAYRVGFFANTSKDIPERVNSMVQEMIDAAEEIDRLRIRLAELEKENDKLRDIIARADIPCVYCGLPKDQMAKCVHGFPGCGRADDLI